MSSQEKLENKLEMQLMTYAHNDISWRIMLRHKYIHIVKLSKDIDWASMTNKEIYSLLRKGIYINNSQQVYILTHYMLPHICNLDGYGSPGSLI